MALAFYQTCPSKRGRVSHVGDNSLTAKLFHKDHPGQENIQVLFTWGAVQCCCLGSKDLGSCLLLP